MKQSTRLRIVHSGDSCLRLVLCTPSGACQQWINKWTNEPNGKTSHSNSHTAVCSLLFCRKSAGLNSERLRECQYLKSTVDKFNDQVKLLVVKYRSWTLDVIAQLLDQTKSCRLVLERSQHGRKYLPAATNQPHITGTHTHTQVCW